MSCVPLGKVLLRNVIRHTDAHNKVGTGIRGALSPQRCRSEGHLLECVPFSAFQIQEESEMWKIREMEKQSEDMPWGKKRKILPDSSW